MSEKRLLSLTSWALYDFANTIFSAVVLTAYFPLYLTELMGANWYLGAATTLSMILAGLAVPFMGALSDQTGRTKRYLIVTTLASIFFLFLFAFVRNPWGLILLFLLACFFYHAALVFYNSLLPVVASKEKQGFASGLGTGLGYLGVVAALPVAHWADNHWGRPHVFSVAALMFLIFSLPVFFWVPERTVDHPLSFRWGLWAEEWKKIGATFRRLKDRPKLALFLGGNFFAVDALNSTIFWFLVFAREVFHPPQSALISLLMGVNVAAFLAGILAGVLTDRLGAMRTMILSTGALALTLGILSAAHTFKFYSAVSVAGGAFAIAGIWTAGRKVLIELAEPERLGEYFGLYGLTTKISVLGNFFFSIAADRAGFRPALLLLIFPSFAGWIFLIWSARIKDRR